MPRAQSIYYSLANPYFQAVHATLLGLRELHNSALPKNLSDNWNSIESGMIGIAELHKLTFCTRIATTNHTTLGEMFQEYSFVGSTGVTAAWVREATWRIMRDIPEGEPVSERSLAAYEELADVERQLSDVSRDEGDRISSLRLGSFEKRISDACTARIEAELSRRRDYDIQNSYRDDSSEAALRLIADEIDFTELLQQERQCHSADWISRNSPASLQNRDRRVTVIRFTGVAVQNWLQKKASVSLKDMALDILLAATTELTMTIMEGTPMQRFLAASPSSGSTIFESASAAARRMQNTPFTPLHQIKGYESPMPQHQSSGRGSAYQSHENSGTPGAGSHAESVQSIGAQVLEHLADSTPGASEEPTGSPDSGFDDIPENQWDDTVLPPRRLPRSNFHKDFPTPRAQRESRTTRTRRSLQPELQNANATDRHFISDIEPSDSEAPLPPSRRLVTPTRAGGGGGRSGVGAMPPRSRSKLDKDRHSMLPSPGIASVD